MAGIILFVFVFLGLLFVVHYVVFASFAVFFSLATPWSRMVVWILSVAFPANFLLASFLAHRIENSVTRLWYTVSAFSLGLISNLFFLVLLGWVVYFFARLFGAQPKMMIFGIAALVLGIAVSVYGISNAFRPIVKQVAVTIPGLPEKLKGKTIVQISDVHLGLVYRADFLRGVVETVNGLHPSAVMIVGDLFDGMDGDLGTLTGPLGNIQADYGTFFVTGNHETYLGIGQSLSALSGTGVKILDDQVEIVDGLAVIGISYPERGSKKDVPGIAASLASSVAGMPNILLYHAPSDIDRMKRSGINLQLSGHTHRGQQFPFNFVTHLVHKGYDYGSYDFGDYVLHTSSGVGTWGPPIRIGTRSEIVAITLH